MSMTNSEVSIHEAVEFKHDPIQLSSDKIRVLKVHPRLESSDISYINCTLQQVPLSTAVYSCLSYTWGTDPAEYLIKINGKPFLVRENLWDFFDHAATKMETTTWLWIDAISIDQNNALERNHQVQKMAEIYGNAQQVLIWMGSIALQEPYLATADTLLASLNRTSRSRTWSGPSGFSDLSRHPYWKRTWILQEIIMAQDPQFILQSDMISFRKFAAQYEEFEDFFRREGLGSRESGVKQLLAICKMVTTPRLRPNRPVPQDSSLLRILREDVEDQSLVKASPARRGRVTESFRVTSLASCISLTRNSLCSDDRDRVYSLVGLCEQLHGLPVKYEADKASLLLDVCEHISSRTLSDMISLMSKVALTLGVQVNIICPRHAKDVSETRAAFSAVSSESRAATNIIRKGEASTSPVETISNPRGSVAKLFQKLDRLLRTEDYYGIAAVQVILETSLSSGLAQTFRSTCQDCPWIPSGYGMEVDWSESYREDPQRIRLTLIPHPSKPPLQSVNQFRFARPTLFF